MCGQLDLALTLFVRGNRRSNPFSSIHICWPRGTYEIIYFRVVAILIAVEQTLAGRTVREDAIRKAAGHRCL